jgi:hypothetical protein
MEATRSDPPTAAGGIVVIWIEGSIAAVSFRQPAETAPSSRSVPRQRMRTETAIIATSENTPFG